LYDCPPDVLNDQTKINEALREAVDRARATLLKQVSNQFSPQGVTALGILAESHISIHTWPEHGYAAVDIFTCGNRAMPERACAYLVDALSAKHHTIERIERGTLLDAATTEFVPKPIAACQPVEA
jgi:S-adenosylmethionine decarboxylase